MSNEAYTSISNRVMSLEDIIRQQEQTIVIVLQRLRDVEQYAAAEVRNREQAQQQLYQLMGDRGGSPAEAAQQVQAILHNQNERLGALQADVQGQAATIRGVDEKFSAAFHGMEQRIQADVGGVHQRLQAGETTSMETMRNLQAQLQSLSNATQAVDTRSRDDLLAVQQQLGAELAAQRQRTDNLESAIRDALRDMHGSLTGELRNSEAQRRADLDGAVQRMSQSVEALDQRTRADLNQLHSVEQGDVSELGRRIEELERNLREVVQASTNGLANEVAQVAQHSQHLDRRQAAAHQTLLQELAKHDGQLESVDLNWRASVTDLSAMVRENMAAVQQQAATGDQALQRQLKALEDRFTAAADDLNRSVHELGQRVREDCVQPLNEVQRTVSAQDQRLGRVADEYAAVQDSLKTFALHVDQDANQFRQVVEAAVRASHADLLERINFASAAITMQRDPEMLRVEVNRALTKLWEDAKGVFLTQRSLSEMEAQLATLESAVRVELCALAERSNDVQRSVDTFRIALQRGAGEAPLKVYHEATRRTTTTTAANGSSPSTPSLMGHETVSAKHSPEEKQQRISSSLTPANSIHLTPSAQTDKTPNTSVRASQSEGQLPPPLPSLQTSTIGPIRKSPSPRPKVEETARDDEGEQASTLCANSSSSYSTRSKDDDCLEQSTQDVNSLRASLNRLRLTQAQGVDRASAAALLRMEDRAAERAAAEASQQQKEKQRHSAEQRLIPHPGAASQRSNPVLYSDVSGAAEQADASSRAAQAAATLASEFSQEARNAANDAAESVRAAEAAQNETLKVANELRLALQRVGKLEESLQRRLAELNAREPNAANAEARPKSGGSSRCDSHSDVTNAFGKRPFTADNGFVLETENGGGHQESPAKQRLHEEEQVPPHARRTSAATAAHMSFFPKKPKSDAARPASAPEVVLVPRASSYSQDNLVEVPGVSKGEVFIVRKEKSDRTTPASVRQRSSFHGQPPLASTLLKDTTGGLAAPATEATVTGSTKLAMPSRSDVSLSAPRRGSGLSEVLLPTHQFVRKREYNNFKEFTKQEIDAVWVELLNGRRKQGMSKEEVLLQISQSKEQLLNTVLRIVQRQENETLGMLSSIKLQLIELRNDPSAMREVRVFPVDNGKYLEDFVRAIGSSSGSASKTSGNETALTSAPVAPEPARPSTSTVVDAVTAFKTTPPSLLHQAPESPPEKCDTLQPAAETSRIHNTLNNNNSNEYCTSSRGRVRPPSAQVQHSAERDSDTAASSGRSSTPLIPQFIPPTVHRRSSLPSKDQLTEVSFADVDHSHPPRLFSKSQSGQPTSAPPLSSATTHGRQYAVAASVNPAIVAPAPRPEEPVSATAQYRPTGLTPPAPRTASPKNVSQPFSAMIDASRRLFLGNPFGTPDASPLDVVSPYASPGAVSQPVSKMVPSMVPHTYQVEKEEPVGMPRRYLKEGKSPRNPAGNAFHLNPLQDMGINRSGNNNTTGGRQQTPPRRQQGGMPVQRVGPQESSGQILQDEPKPYDSRPLRYQLMPSTPPSQATELAKGASVAPPPLLMETLPDKHQSMPIEEGSAVYYESVGSQRPARRSLRRSSTSTHNTPTHTSNNLRGMRGTLPPGHLYNHADSGSDSQPVPRRSRSHTSALSSPEDVGQTREQQYAPLLPQQQSHRDHTPVHDLSTNAVRISTAPPLRNPLVQVPTSKGLIHLGPYNPLNDNGEREVTADEQNDSEVIDADTNRSSRLVLSPSSLPSPPHTEHNPHVYAPQGAHHWDDVCSIAQSLAGSPSPERGARGRTPTSRHDSPSAGPETTATAVVPVRVLDGPVNRPGPAAVPVSVSQQRQQSGPATTIRIHPYY